MLFKQNFMTLALASTALAQFTSLTSFGTGVTSVASATGTASDITSSRSSGTSTSSTSSSSAQAFASGTTTISAYLFSAVSAAAVVTANACSTVLAYRCVDEDVDQAVCQSVSAAGLSVFTYTARPTGNTATIAVTTRGASGSLVIGCSYQGTGPTFTGQVCSETIFATSAGTSTSLVATTTQRRSIAPTALTITSGVDKLPTGSQTCTNTGTAGNGNLGNTLSGGTGTGSSTGGAARPTAMVVELYKVLVPVGVAVAAGAAYL